jgi:AbrB family looped-hinge helix DNA binding protein
MRITSKGQVTIPQAIREQAGLHPLSEVEFELRANGEVLADCAVVLSIQSVQGNPVEWVMPTRSVLVTQMASVHSQPPLPVPRMV